MIAPEELPKGVRKEVRINGVSILLFWYRNQIFAIDARSPAEGAYSEGFIKAKFTQDYGIECPTTGSTFSLRDGSIIDWYPTNPVLRSVNPKTGSMTVCHQPFPRTYHPEYVSVLQFNWIGTFKKTKHFSLENHFNLMHLRFLTIRDFPLFF